MLWIYDINLLIPPFRGDGQKHPTYTIAISGNLHVEVSLNITKM